MWTDRLVKTTSHCHEMLTADWLQIGTDVQSTDSLLTLGNPLGKEMKMFHAI